MHVNPRTSDSTDGEPTTGWFVSLAFWLTLFLAAGMYAAVALAPKLERMIRLRADRMANQTRLVNLESRVEQLERVVAALEHDAAFSEELARLRYGSNRPGDQVISLPAGLQLDTTNPQVVNSQPELPWYYSALRQFSGNSWLRAGLLTGAGAVLLFGFGFLHGRYAAQVHRTLGRVGRFARVLGGRYRSANP